MNTEQLLPEAMTELSNRNFDRAIELCTLVLSECPDSDEGLACRVIRACAYEQDESSDRMLNLSNAIEDYSILVSKSGRAKAVGHAGLARALYLQDAASNAQRIKTHADAAIRMSDHVPSMVLAGAIARDHFADERLARKYFLRVAKARDYWGLQYFFRSLAMKFGWISLLVIVPTFYLLAPFFKTREQPFVD